MGNRAAVQQGGYEFGGVIIHSGNDRAKKEGRIAP
jgi:hypothetical protein